MACKMSQAEKNAFLKLPKRCIHSIEYGTNCGHATQKWYFDTDMKLCYPFEYTGCGPADADANRFATAEDCTITCTDTLNKYYKPEGDSKSSYATPSQVDSPDRTSSTTSSMPSFKRPTGNPAIEDYDICELPIAVGNCTQKTLKWVYDSSLRYCREFEFTGCNGNENRFETRHQCIDICEIHKRRGFLLFD